MVEAIVRPAGPYMLSLSARHAGDATRTFRDGVFSATLEVDGVLERAFARQSPDGRVHVAGASAEGLERLRFCLAVDDDHSEFLRRFRGDPLLGRSHEPPGRTATRARGHRRPRAAAGVLRPADHVAARHGRSSGGSSARRRPRSIAFTRRRPGRRLAPCLRRSCAAWVFMRAAGRRSFASAARSTSSGYATCRRRTSRRGCSASAGSARGRSASSRWRGSAAGITASSATSGS